MSNLIYRNLEKRDYADVMEMIDNAWHLDKYADNRRSKAHMLHAFMRAVLMMKNYDQVAEMDGKVVGLLFGKVPKLKGFLKNAVHVPAALFHALCLCFGKAERNVLAHMQNVQTIYAQLRRKTGIRFDAELEFFVVHERSRGYGVGKKLLENYLAFCGNHGVKNLYLYTDDNCNFGFYDHNGFTRAGTSPVSVQLHGGKLEYNNYIYIKKLLQAGE